MYVHIQLFNSTLNKMAAKNMKKIKKKTLRKLVKQNN